jgi:hypothetical protein
MAFHVDSGQSQVLLSNVLADWFAFPDKRHVQTAWQEPTQAVLGLVDVLTGTRVALAPLSFAGVSPVSDADPFRSGSLVALSPDGAVAAMLLREDGISSSLALAATDGSWRREVPLVFASDLPPGDSGLDLLWSPDSRSILVTYNLGLPNSFRYFRRTILNTGMDVIGLDGLSTFHDSYTSEFAPRITWSSCRIN